jgi:hypothetical protein
VPENADATPVPFAATDRTANADISRAVSGEPHSGQLASVEPLAFTSSSKRWSQPRHANS